MALGVVGRWLVDSAVFFSVLFLVLVFVPGIPPEGNFTSLELEPLLERSGAFAPNRKLDAAVRLFEGTFSGPESVAVRGRELFVSMHGGYIVRVFGDRYDQFEPVLRIGSSCAGPHEEEVCGRPLGLRFSRDGRLLVADAYLGVWAVDVDSGAKERLVDPGAPIAGQLPRLTDDLDEDASGNLYWSDASALSTLKAGLMESLAGGSGRLIRRDAGSGQNLVLLDGLMFANGVQLSPEEDFVLVCETYASRVLRYWLHGPKTGQTDVFVAGLPGYPDNIRARPQGGYLVSLVVVKAPGAPDLTRLLAPRPWLRRLCARLLWGAKAFLDGATALCPNRYTAALAHKVLDLSLHAQRMAVNASMVVALTPEGAVGGVWEGAGPPMFISEAVEVGDKMFFGSPYSPYLGMLDLAPEEGLKEGLAPEDPEEKEGLALEGSPVVRPSRKEGTARKEGNSQSSDGNDDALPKNADKEPEKENGKESRKKESKKSAEKESKKGADKVGSKQEL